MYDSSDRFLHQLAADRRASLLRSGRASSKRPFRRALGAVLARLGLVADRDRGESASLEQSLPAPTNSKGTCSGGYQGTGCNEAALLDEIRSHALEGHGVVFSVDDALLVVQRAQLYRPLGPLTMDIRGSRVSANEGGSS